MGNKKKDLTSLWVLIIFGVIAIIFLNSNFFSEQGGLESKTNQEINKQKIIQPQIKEYSYYINPLPSGMTEKYINTIREATAYWEIRENVIFREVSDETQADFRIQWVKEFGVEHIGYAYGNQFIEIGLGDSNCLEKWRVYSYDAVLTIAIHELGHILGKEHINDEKNIMYPVIQKLGYELEIEEEDILPDGWIRFYPTCTKKEGNVKYSFEVISDEKVNIYIVPSSEEYSKFLEDKEFQYYLECFEEKTTYYKETCVLDSKGGIMIENPTILGLGDTAQFEIKIKELLGVVK